MKKAECIIATFAGRPLDVGKWGAAVPIAWRSGPGMLSPPANLRARRMTPQQQRDIP